MSTLMALESSHASGGTHVVGEEPQHGRVLRVLVAEAPQRRHPLEHLDALSPRPLEQILVVRPAARARPIRAEEARAAAERDVDGEALEPCPSLADQEARDLALEVPVGDVGVETCGCGVRQARGGDEAGREALTLGGLEDGAAGRARRGDADAAIVRLERTCEGSRTRGRVCGDKLSVGTSKNSTTLVETDQ